MMQPIPEQGSICTPENWSWVLGLWEAVGANLAKINAQSRKSQIWEQFSSVSLVLIHEANKIMVHCTEWDITARQEICWTLHPLFEQRNCVVKCASWTDDLSLVASISHLYHQTIVILGFLCAVSFCSMVNGLGKVLIGKIMIRENTFCHLICCFLLVLNLNFLKSVLQR